MANTSSDVTHLASQLSILSFESKPPTQTSYVTQETTRTHLSSLQLCTTPSATVSQISPLFTIPKPVLGIISTYLPSNKDFAHWVQTCKASNGMKNEILANDPEKLRDFLSILCKQGDKKRLDAFIASLAQQKYKTSALVLYTSPKSPQIKEMLATIQQKFVIEGLIITEKTSTDEEIQALLTTCPGINILRFKEVSSKILEKTKFLPNITELHIEKTTITPAFLEQILSQCPSLESLNFSDCVIDESVLLTQTNIFNNLKKFELRNTNVSERVLHALLQKFPGIVTLNVSCCKNLSENYFPTLNIPHLQVLFVGACNVNDYAVYTILTKHPQLKGLYLTGCRKITQNAFPKNLELQVLALNRTNITEYGFVKIVKCCPKLQRFFVNDCEQVNEEALKKALFPQTIYEIQVEHICISEKTKVEMRKRYPHLCWEKKKTHELHCSRGS